MLMSLYFRLWRALEQLALTWPWEKAMLPTMKINTIDAKPQERRAKFEAW